MSYSDFKKQAAIQKYAMNPATKIFLSGLLGMTGLGAAIGAGVGAAKGDAKSGAIRGATIGGGATLGETLGINGARLLNRKLLGASFGSKIPIAGYAGITAAGDIGGLVGGIRAGNAVGKKLTKKSSMSKEAAFGYAYHAKLLKPQVGALLKAIADSFKFAKDTQRPVKNLTRWLGSDIKKYLPGIVSNPAVVTPAVGAAGIGAGLGIGKVTDKAKD